jgi:putative addiction module component (TIGR02574 family)
LDCFASSFPGELLLEEFRFDPSIRPCPQFPLRYNFNMATITEIERLANDLPASERAVLAAHLLQSLPPVLFDLDEGIAEALAREHELDANPNLGITLEQLDEYVRNRQR